VDGGKKSVLVLSNPDTPMIVCANPLATEKQPSPLEQSHVPAVGAGSQHHLSSSQVRSKPSFADTGLSAQN
jgi:hypothetical protein